jgi:hypothetical protein
MRPEGRAPVLLARGVGLPHCFFFVPGNEESAPRAGV